MATGQFATAEGGPLPQMTQISQKKEAGMSVPIFAIREVCGVMGDWRKHGSRR